MQSPAAATSALYTSAASTCPYTSHHTPASPTCMHLPPFAPRALSLPTLPDLLLCLRCLVLTPGACVMLTDWSSAAQPIPSLFHRPYHFNFRPSTFDYGPVAPRVATAGRTDLHTIVRTLSTNIHTVISILAHTYLRFCNVPWCIEHHQHQQQQYGVCKRCRSSRDGSIA